MIAREDSGSCPSTRYARGNASNDLDRPTSQTPVSPKDVLATTCHLLGIDPETTLTDRLGRPLPVGGGGMVRAELLA